MSVCARPCASVCLCAGAYVCPPPLPPPRTHPQVGACARSPHHVPLPRDRGVPTGALHQPGAAVVPRALFGVVAIPPLRRANHVPRSTALTALDSKTAPARQSACGLCCAGDRGRAAAATEARHRLRDEADAPEGPTARVRSCECIACVPRVCAARQACSVRSCRRRSWVLIIVGKGTDNRNKGTDKLCQGH